MNIFTFFKKFRNNFLLVLIIILLFNLSFSFITCSGGEGEITTPPEEETEEAEEEPEEERPDPNEGPIYLYQPKDGEVTLGSDSIIRKVTFGEKDLINPLLLGVDSNENFLLYYDEVKQVIKYSNDGSLGVIVLEEDSLMTSEGKYISGHIKDEKICLLQQSNNDNDEYILRFFDISGNRLSPDSITFSNIKEILINEGIEFNDKFNFIAQDVVIMENDNIAVSINEVSEDNDHIAVNRPQFIIFNPQGDIVSIITVIPPKPQLTGFSETKYWEDSTVDKFHFDTAIYKNEGYILWGSGYSRKSTLGYLYQVVSLKTGGAGNYATRLLKEDHNKDNMISDRLPDEHNYASRGIWVDDGNIYIRLKLEDGTDIIDMYNSRSDYRKKYVLKDIPELGETSLIGPNNILVNNNIVFWSSNQGLSIINLDKPVAE
ncbi:MAG: hypothetical protein ACOCV8_01905 [Spirochaetota bacterium]